MGKVVLLFVLLTAVAQAFPSCGSRQGDEPIVIGWVEEKHLDPATRNHAVVINHIEYYVPVTFYNQVQVGDLVKWDGLVWTIVKKREALSRYRV